MSKVSILVFLVFVAVIKATAKHFDFDAKVDAGLKAPDIVFPTDEQEIYNLPNEQKQFEEFCKQSRDYAQEMSKSAGSLINLVTQTLLRAGDETTLESSRAIRKASIYVGPQFEDARKNIDSRVLEAAGVIQKSYDEMKLRGQNPQTQLVRFEQFVKALSVSAGNVIAAGFTKLQNHLRQHFIWEAVVRVCNRAEISNQAYKTQFDITKVFLTGVDNVQYEDLKCATSSRIVKMVGLCSFVSKVK